MAIESRPVRAFVLHGRVGGDLLDYEEFFSWVAALPRNATRVQVTQDLVLAIEKSVPTTSGFHFRFVSGNPNEVPLLYVEETGETITEEVSVGRWRAVATRVAVHPSNRLLAIEMRRAGVGATNLERYFSRLAKDNDYYSRLSLDMNPLPSPSFAVELEEFERIREASIVVRRPNTDWDDADDVLSQLADDSWGTRPQSQSMRAVARVWRGTAGSWS